MVVKEALNKGVEMGTGDVVEFGSLAGLEEDIKAICLDFKGLFMCNNSEDCPRARQNESYYNTDLFCLDEKKLLLLDAKVQAMIDFLYKKYKTLTQEYDIFQETFKKLKVDIDEEIYSGRRKIDAIGKNVTILQEKIDTIGERMGAGGGRRLEKKCLVDEKEKLEAEKETIVKEIEKLNEQKHYIQIKFNLATHEYMSSLETLGGLAEDIF